MSAEQLADGLFLFLTKEVGAANQRLPAPSKTSFEEKNKNVFLLLHKTDETPPSEPRS